MSRTFRRTDKRGQHYLIDRILRNFVNTDDDFRGICWMRYKVDRNSDEGKKLVSEFHRDSYTRYGCSVPSFICNMRQRSIRWEGNRQLHRFIRNSDYEVLLNARHRHDAYWYYW